MDDNRFTSLEKCIEEIKESQNKIAQALLGSYEKNTIGLIEEARNLRRDMDEIKGSNKLHTAQITEVIEFKRDAKKIVGAIAIIIPFIFELLKLGGSALWEFFKNAK